MTTREKAHAVDYLPEDREDAALAALEAVASEDRHYRGITAFHGIEG